MARKSTPKAGQGKQGRVKGRAVGAGRLVVRRETSAYRAVESEQTLRVRAEIDAALENARRTRQEIEAHIESEWQHRTASGVTQAVNRSGFRK
ncbi:hypothetical protein POL68_26770 [Stigmatella sp. ncwal1]|uniref:Uncharacterized protein n=1 Tax=Stigmatella ashevillensis TaxID=2995309 RepID=A0ABT5DH72_9BACT|nr:hypothetical protein [Stigmatella ashevillena]MDC0712098.1 hypothetical protein [Stigmatella ashevillena]